MWSEIRNPPYGKRWRLVHLLIDLREQEPKNAHKNAKKSSKNFKLSMRNAASTGTNLCKKYGFL